MDEKKISNAEVREILEKQLQLLSERSKEIVRSGRNGDELPLLTDTMIQLAVILEPETQSDNLIDYLEKQQFWAQIREHWRQQHAQN